MYLIVLIIDILPTRKNRTLSVAWGTKAIVACDVPMALPSPTFRIYRNNVLRSNTNVYTIDRVSYRYNNVIYECVVSNIAGTVRSNITIQVAGILDKWLLFENFIFCGKIGYHQISTVFISSYL